MTGPQGSNEGGSIWMLLLAMSPVILGILTFVALFLRNEWQRWKKRRKKR